MDDATDLMSIGDRFKIPCKTIATGNVEFGVVLRFKTFYLKIYNSGKENGFDVSGFRLWDPEPKFKFVIPYHQFQEFVDQITEDNYLDNPIHVTWIH